MLQSKEVVQNNSAMAHTTFQAVMRQLLTIRPLTENTSTTFRFWMVEILLGSAGELLDRCQSLRSQLFDISSRETQWKIERARAILEFEDAEPQADPAFQTAWRASEEKWHDYLYAEEAYWIDVANRFKENNSREFAEFCLRKQRWQFERDFSGYGATMARLPGHRSYAAQRAKNAALQRFNTVQSFAGLQVATDKPSEILKAPEDEVTIFKTMRDNLHKELERDLQEVCDRLQSAFKGMERVYHIRAKGGTLADKIAQGNDMTEDAIATCVNITRDALAWLSAASAWDQGFVITVSLKNELRKEEFANFIEGKSVYFKIPVEVTSKYRGVRLRSLAASYVSKQERPASFLALELIPPKIGLVYGDGHPSLPKMREIDQSDSPKCLLGKVLSVSEPFLPESAAVGAIYNFSPIASDSDPGWSVQLISFTRLAPAVIEDVVLELRCAGHPTIAPPTYIRPNSTLEYLPS